MTESPGCEAPAPMMYCGIWTENFENVLRGRGFGSKSSDCVVEVCFVSVALLWCYFLRSTELLLLRLCFEIDGAG